MKTLSSAFADLLFFSRYFGGGAIYIRGTISVTLSLLASLLSHLTFSSLSRQMPCYLIPILFPDSLRVPWRNAQPLRLHDDDADDEALHQRRIHGHIRRLGDVQLGEGQRIPMELSRLLIFIHISSFPSLSFRVLDFGPLSYQVAGLISTILYILIL